MPFPIILTEYIESLNFAQQLGILFTYSMLLYWKSYSFVRFLPHLLMVKYHVLSMKYFVDVTLFIPKYRRIFYFMATYVPTIVVLS